MEHCEYTLRIEAIIVPTMNQLIDVGVCALSGCTNFVILHNYFKKDIKCIFGRSNLMLRSKSPFIRRKTKRKVQYCQIWKVSSFQMNPHSKPISFANLVLSGV